MRVLILGVLLLASCGFAEAPKSGPPAAAPVPVRVEVAASALLERVVTAVGVVAALDSVEIRPETSGLVQEVRFTDGEEVRRGAVLVRLRGADADAALLEARARARLATLQLDRAKALFERGDVARAELDRAEADDALARAAVQKASEAVRRTTILAPFDGTLGLRAVSPGQTVDPSRVLTRIEALGVLAVDIALPESALGRVAKGQAAHVMFPALATETDGSVSYVSPRVSEETRTVEVRVTLEPREGGLVQPGMSAEVRIVTASVPDALLVPTEALSTTASGAALWIVGADGTVARRPVTIGERTAARVEVTSGLAVGESVVVEGLARMRPGAAVTVSGK